MPLPNGFPYGIHACAITGLSTKAISNKYEPKPDFTEQPKMFWATRKYCDHQKPSRKCAFVKGSNEQSFRSGWQFWGLRSFWYLSHLFRKFLPFPSALHTQFFKNISSSVAIEQINMNIQFDSGWTFFALFSRKAFQSTPIKEHFQCFEI